MNRKSGAVLLLLIIFVMLSAYVSYATVPDADGDGVPDADDKCSGSLTTVVDQFGCTCAQKITTATNN